MDAPLYVILPAEIMVKLSVGLVVLVAPLKMMLLLLLLLANNVVPLNLAPPFVLIVPDAKTDKSLA